jgi:hypothetical protein
MVLAEMICLRQYISETIVHFLNRQGGSNLRVNIQTIEILRIFLGGSPGITYSKSQCANILAQL